LLLNVFIVVVVDFFIDSVRKLLDTPPYTYVPKCGGNNVYEVLFGGPKPLGSRHRWEDNTNKFLKEAGATFTWLR